MPEPELKSEVFEYLSGRKVRHYFLNFSILALIAWLLDPAIAGKLFFSDFWHVNSKMQSKRFQNGRRPEREKVPDAKFGHYPLSAFVFLFI